MQSCDVGSLPYADNYERLFEGADHFAAKLQSESARFFEQTIVKTFIDKLKTGISVPAFPQFRDMNGMFLSTFEGLEKIKDGYVEVGPLALKSGFSGLPEAGAIKRNTDVIEAELGNPFQLRLCVTGPYTLASFFPYKSSQTYVQLGRVLAEIVEQSVFVVKQNRVTLVSIDEPVFGMIDDPLIDRGTEGRENLLAAWEAMASKARSKKAEACIHLHCTMDDLFWDVESLRIVESHVDDPIFQMKNTRERLEAKDKLLKASIAISDFDRLIRERLSESASDEAVAEAWKNIAEGTVNPERFLEDAGLMEKRLLNAVERFGTERVVFAGTECGLKGFPSYATALECLRRVSQACRLTA